jgi:tRNA pseudouridine55 synthase
VEDTLNNTLNGIIVMNKPQGMTSHDVVGFVRRMTGVKKVGHTGTLDPMAEGVLPVCVGGATRVIEFIMGGADAAGFGAEPGLVAGPDAADVDGARRCVNPDAKAYDCEMRLGVTTDTLDVWGSVTAETDGAEVRGLATPERIREVFASMTGEVEQTPPAYSAVKYKGRKLYEYARSGEELPAEALKPRRVHIKSIDVTDVVIDGERTERRVTAGAAPSPERGGSADRSGSSSKGFATVRFSVVCSGGVYVRSIVRDAGTALGCGAAMSALTRTKSGVFTLADAHTVEEVERAAACGGLTALVLPIDAALPFMPAVTLDEKARVGFINGVRQKAEQTGDGQKGQSGDGSFLSHSAGSCHVRVYGGGRFIGVGAFADGMLLPYKVIVT